ncbi:DMT family transporter [Marinomonas agarivorans]|nr:DMT family transporter [Marinomonas agarivorans]
MSHSNTVPSYRILAQGRHFHLGVFAAIATACIWASWLLSVKVGLKSDLTLFDLAIMRYGGPSIVFAYFMYRSWSQIRKVPWRVLIGICCGAGVPFFYLASQGMAQAPVAHSGLLIAGTAPLFVTSIAVFIYKEPLSLSRLLGLCAIGVGIIVLLSASLVTMQIEVLMGDLHFLLASMCWAVFTICLRVSGLSPFAATGLLGLVNSAILLLLLVFGVLDSSLNESQRGNIEHASLVFWLFQFVVQALVVGVFAGITYGIAINRIGAEATAAIGSLTPVLAALGAYILLAEQLSKIDILAMLLMAVGVIAASEILKTIRLPQWVQTTCLPFLKIEARKIKE